MPPGKDERNLFLETLTWLCSALSIQRIPYMITGGAAVGFWGHIRTTMDIDIVVQIPAAKLETLLKTIDKDAYINIEEAKNAILHKTMFNVILNSTYFKIDIIPLNEDDVYEMEKFERRMKIRFHSREIYVISPEDLIISKLIWSKAAGGSERQLRDCGSIWKLNQEKIDKGYIEKWVKRLEIKDEFAELKVEKII